MSASLTAAQTGMRLRSLASRNRLGAFMPATTVWPTLTRRSITMPSTGERIVGVFEIDLGLLLGDLGLLELGFAHGDFRLGHLVFGLGLFEFGLGIGASQLLGAAEGPLRLLAAERGCGCRSASAICRLAAALSSSALCGRSSSWASTAPCLTREL